MLQTDLSLKQYPSDTTNVIDQDDNSRGLHWSQRPEDLRSYIISDIQMLSQETGSQWGLCNGSTGYYDLYSARGEREIDEAIVIQAMILQKMQQGQRAFRLMEVGAGNFQFGKYIAKVINKNPLFRGISVFIYSLRGERNTQYTPRVDGICTLYEYGSFAVENLIEEFKNQGLNFEKNGFDFIVSSFCLRHLNDPTGTLLQMLELLREGGVSFVDGFFLETPGKNYEKCADENLIRLFKSTRLPFFRVLNNGGHRLNWFGIQKRKKTVHIPLEYNSIIRVADGYQCFSRKAVLFQPLADWPQEALAYEKIALKDTSYDQISAFDEESEAFYRNIRSSLEYVMTATVQAIKEKFKLLCVSGNNDEQSELLIRDIYLLLVDLINKKEYVKTLDCMNWLLEENKENAVSLFNYSTKNEPLLIWRLSIWRETCLPVMLILLQNTKVANLNVEHKGEFFLIKLFEKYTSYDGLFLEDAVNCCIRLKGLDWNVTQSSKKGSITILSLLEKEIESYKENEEACTAEIQNLQEKRVLIKQFVTPDIVAPQPLLVAFNTPRKSSVEENPEPKHGGGPSM